MKILLVEDSPTLRHTTAFIIAEAGHEPITANSGEEALQLIEQSPVDMIIMDVEMPGLNGFETTRLIREWLGDHWIPIVFVTGKSDDKSYKEGIDAGGDDYLVKPISPIILKAKITAMERITEMRNQLHKLNDKLETLSQIDGLTQIYNRRTFSEMAKRDWLQMAREHKSVTVLMIDIDHFKLYNDHYGHPAGDACLQKVAQCIQSSLQRPKDLLGRYGGEEFIVFLTDTDHWDSVHVAERIRQNIEALDLEHCKSPTSSAISLSIGGAVSMQTTGRSLEQLIILADKSLYEAKKMGRNTVHVEQSKPVKRVLVADCDPNTVKLLGDTLHNHCQLLITDNGIDCLKLVQQNAPDLILLDINLPKLSGADVCKELKQKPSTSSIPIILISSEDRKLQVQEGKKVGANDCLQRPLKQEPLLSKINRYLA
jgi:diguanylate cyclase (GGDEF)-like protein